VLQGDLGKGWKDWTFFNQLQVVSGSLNQQKAEEACHGMGGSLASIHSTEENDFLLSNFI
jgi:hypothetical protein